jgi:hypothetical protein
VTKADLIEAMIDYPDDAEVLVLVGSRAATTSIPRYRNGSTVPSNAFLIEASRQTATLIL